MIFFVIIKVFYVFYICNFPDKNKHLKINLEIEMYLKKVLFFLLLLSCSFGFATETITLEDAVQLALQMIGASDVPSSISIYANSFDAKQHIINYIGEWNQKQTTTNNKITYSDATAFLTDTLGNLIDIISYVLIAFAAISLIVSSIMIGIITYTSVIERTKEIGLLRSLGARKKDISRVFNSETM